MNYGNLQMSNGAGKGANFTPTPKNLAIIVGVIVVALALSFYLKSSSASAKVKAEQAQAASEATLAQKQVEATQLRTRLAALQSAGGVQQLTLVNSMLKQRTNWPEIMDTLGKIERSINKGFYSQGCKGVPQIDKSLIPGAKPFKALYLKCKRPEDWRKLKVVFSSFSAMEPGGAAPVPGAAPVDPAAAADAPLVGVTLSGYAQSGNDLRVLISKLRSTKSLDISLKKVQIFASGVALNNATGQTTTFNDKTIPDTVSKGAKGDFVLRDFKFSLVAGLPSVPPVTGPVAPVAPVPPTTPPAP